MPTGIRIKSLDGTEIALVPVEGAADIFFAGRRDVHAYPLSLAAAIRLAWFILWYWWFRLELLGIRTWWRERKMKRKVLRAAPTT